jgi:hypothetical protein
MRDQLCEKPEKGIVFTLALPSGKWEAWLENNEKARVFGDSQAEVLGAYWIANDGDFPFLVIGRGGTSDVGE